jgi:hypothetical protein
MTKGSASFSASKQRKRATMGSPVILKLFHPLWRQRWERLGSDGLTGAGCWRWRDPAVYLGRPSAVSRQRRELAVLLLLKERP